MSLPLIDGMVIAKYLSPPNSNWSSIPTLTNFSVPRMSFSTSLLIIFFSSLLLSYWKLRFAWNLRSRDVFLAVVSSTEKINWPRDHVPSSEQDEFFYPFHALTDHCQFLPCFGLEWHFFNLFVLNSFHFQSRKKSTSVLSLTADFWKLTSLNSLIMVSVFSVTESAFWNKLSWSLSLPKSLESRGPRVFWLAESQCLQITIQDFLL